MAERGEAHHHEWVSAAEDGDAGTPVARDDVVLDDTLGVVAHEHADALAVVHLVVQDVPNGGRAPSERVVIRPSSRTAIRRCPADGEARPDGRAIRAS